MIGQAARSGGFDVPAGTFTRDTAFASRLVDGRIAERWAIRDDLAMLLQLGALEDERWRDTPTAQVPTVGDTSSAGLSDLVCKWRGG